MRCCGGKTFARGYLRRGNAHWAFPPPPADGYDPLAHTHDFVFARSAIKPSRGVDGCLPPRGRKKLWDQGAFRPLAGPGRARPGFSLNRQRHGGEGSLRGEHFPRRWRRAGVRGFLPRGWRRTPGTGPETVAAVASGTERPLRVWPRKRAASASPAPLSGTGKPSSGVVTVQAPSAVTASTLISPGGGRRR